MWFHSHEVSKLLRLLEKEVEWLPGEGGVGSCCSVGVVVLPRWRYSGDVLHSSVCVVNTAVYLEMVKMGDRIWFWPLKKKKTRLPAGFCCLSEALSQVISRERETSWGQMAWECGRPDALHGYFRLSQLLKLFRPITSPAPLKKSESVGA